MLALLSDVVARANAVALGQAPDARLRWGERWLDASLGPAVPGMPYVVAARPTVGKSMFGLRIAVSAGVPALIVSLEDPAEELGRRAAGLTPEQLELVRCAFPSRPTLKNVVRAIEEAIVESGVRLVVVDYLQYIQYDGDIECWSRPHQIEVMISELAAVAKDQGLVLVLLAQLRRPSGDDGEPAIHDIADSSAVEKAAHSIVLLNDPDDDTVEARVGKCKSRKRGGRTTYLRSEPHGWLVEVTRAPAGESPFPQDMQPARMTPQEKAAAMLGGGKEMEF